MSKRILIVRPDAQAQKDLATCQAAGIPALAVSPMRLITHAQNLASLPEKVASADIVFWVSPSAVSIAAPHLTWPQTTHHLAVGSSTTAALRAFTPTVFFPESGNDSEAVLSMPFWQHFRPSETTVLIIRGENGRPFLAETLIKKGFQVDIADVYRREAAMIDWHSVTAFAPNIAYIPSSESVHTWFTQMPPKLAQSLKNLLYLTQHSRIANALRAGGAKHIMPIESLAHYLKIMRETE